MARDTHTYEVIQVSDFSSIYGIYGFTRTNVDEERFRSLVEEAAWDHYAIRTDLQFGHTVLILPDRYVTMSEQLIHEALNNTPVNNRNPKWTSIHLKRKLYPDKYPSDTDKNGSPYVTQLSLVTNDVDHGLWDSSDDDY